MGSDLLTFYLEQQNRQTMEGCFLLVKRRHCRDWLRIIIIDHHMDGSWNIIIIIMSPALSAGFVSVLNVFFTLRTTLEIELSWFIALVVFWFSLFKTVKIDSTFEIENDNKLASACHAQTSVWQFKSSVLFDGRPGFVWVRHILPWLYRRSRWSNLRSTLISNSIYLTTWANLKGPIRTLYSLI